MIYIIDITNQQHKGIVENWFFFCFAYMAKTQKFTLWAFNLTSGEVLHKYRRSPTKIQRVFSICGTNLRSGCLISYAMFILLRKLHLFLHSKKLPTPISTSAMALKKQNKKHPSRVGFQGSNCKHGKNQLRINLDRFDREVFCRCLPKLSHQHSSCIKNNTSTQSTWIRILALRLHAHVKALK